MKKFFEFISSKVLQKILCFHKISSKIRETDTSCDINTGLW